MPLFLHLAHADGGVSFPALLYVHTVYRLLPHSTERERIFLTFPICPKQCHNFWFTSLSGAHIIITTLVRTLVLQHPLSWRHDKPTYENSHPHLWYSTRPPHPPPPPAEPVCACVNLSYSITVSSASFFSILFFSSLSTSVSLLSLVLPHGGDDERAFSL